MMDDTPRGKRTIKRQIKELLDQKKHRNKTKGKKNKWWVRVRRRDNKPPIGHGEARVCMCVPALRLKNSRRAPEEPVGERAERE